MAGSQDQHLAQLVVKLLTDADQGSTEGAERLRRKMLKCAQPPWCTRTCAPDLFGKTHSEQTMLRNPDQGSTEGAERLRRKMLKCAQPLGRRCTCLRVLRDKMSTERCRPGQHGGRRAPAQEDAQVRTALRVHMHLFAQTVQLDAH